MPQFLHSLPEQAENPLPPALAGEIVAKTPLHTLRLRQLQDLAKAYDIDLPDGATKNEVLPIMVTHERAGRFRQPPVSRYDLLRAEVSHDVKLEPHERQAREQRLAAAAAQRTAKPAEAPAQDFETQASLRAKAKALGINCYGKSNGQLRALIAAKDANDESAAPSAVAAE